MSEIGDTERPLAAQLEKITADALTQLPKEVIQIFAEKTAELVASDLVNQALKVGQAVEDFSIRTTTGDSIVLREKLDQGPVVLSFYRGTWCPYCSLEFEALAASSAEASKSSASLLAISPQREKRYEPSLRAINFHDAIDESNHLAQEFGLVYDLGKKMTEVYRGFGIDLSEMNGTATFQLPVPASYVLDRDSVVRYAFINPDYSKRAEPSEILTVVRELAA